MYRKYLSGLQNITVEAITKGLSNLSVEDLNHKDTSKDHVSKTVQECWKFIESQLALSSKNDSKRVPEPEYGWKTVRVFVSSTFTDFYWEREALVKKVFPELREWCEERKLYLIECDLRWGIPSDSTTHQTVSTCLEEIDKCIAETGGQPFFLNMTGERYGWIPKESEIPEETRKQYQWVPNTSITFMEVLHGAFRTGNPNALFCMRQSDVIKDIPESHLQRFQDPDPLCQKHLKVYKSKLVEWFSKEQVFSYSSKYDGMTTIQDRETVVIGELDEFASYILQFFKRVIERKYPNRKEMKSPSYLEEEFMLHRKFVEQKANVLLSREKELQLLMDYALGKPVTVQFEMGTEGQPMSRDEKFWTSDLTGDPILCVEGKPGYGKTTLLAKVVQSMSEHSNVSVFYHFCGSTGSSGNVNLLLQRLLVYLSQVLADTSVLPQEEVLEEEYRTKSWDDFREDLRSLLTDLPSSKRSKPILLVFDAVDQLQTSEYVTHLSWLPPVFPPNIRCIVSTSNHPPTVCRIQEHRHYIMSLQPLDRSASLELIQTNLKMYSKRLDESHFSILMESPCIDTPLWLYVICEELRIHGDFRSLTMKVKSLSSSVQDLLKAVLDRLLTEDTTNLMKKAVRLIASASGVLTSLDLQRMLGNVEERTMAAPLDWAILRRHLKPYIRVAGYNEQITFVHNALRMAVTKTLLDEQRDIIDCSTILADYYETWSENTSARIEVLPYYLTQAGLTRRLCNFLREAPEAKHIPSFRRSEYFRACRCRHLADPVIPMTAPVMICRFCLMKKANFFPDSYYSNEHSCVVCGCNTQGLPPVDAYLCMSHSAGQTVMSRCFVCGNVVDRKRSDIGGKQAKLCHLCGFGNFGKQCADLVLS
ncbi:hypothetical protein ACJMK2_029701 [Sinanodonta woodiana]|uniref:NACHT domain-containing protein n=1 Tax=Sinanodonta woodiana TaxID=1069815 RepID=A0ABD3XEZ9_SINWO